MENVKAFELKDISDHILGKAIYDMCEVLKKHVPDEYDAVIKSGLSRIMNIELLMGIIMGLLIGAFIGFMIGTLI